MVDSTAADRFGEAKGAMESVVRDPTLPANIPVVLAINKCNNDGAAEESEVEVALAAEVLLDGRPWKSFKTDAKKGDGCNHAFEWMASEIKTQRKKAGKHKK